MYLEEKLLEDGLEDVTGQRGQVAERGGRAQLQRNGAHACQVAAHLVILPRAGRTRLAARVRAAAPCLGCRGRWQLRRRAVLALAIGVLFCSGGGVVLGESRSFVGGALAFAEHLARVLDGAVEE